MTLVLLLLALAVADGSHLEVLSANGRYVARVAAEAAEGSAAEMRDVSVFERRAGDPERRVWTGRLPDELAAGVPHLDLLSDDGAALVRIVAERGGKHALVRELLKGSAATAIDAHDLGLTEAGADPWIDLETGLRWRADPSALNCAWKLDLLGQDGLVRTLELDGGMLTLQRDPTLDLSLVVHPDIATVLFPATRELFVDSWKAPELADAGATVEVEGHGRFPSAGWRFAGFEVLGDARATKKLVLVPRGVPPRGASAQVLQPHLWTARFGGLPPGVYALEVVGLETAQGDPKRDPKQSASATRTLELVSPRLTAEVRRSNPPAGGWRSVALFDDGRIELGLPAGRRVHLATLARWQALAARAAALAAPVISNPGEPSMPHASLLWRTPDGPKRAPVDKTLSPSALALADELSALANELDPTQRARLYELDVAASSVSVQARAGGPAASTPEFVAGPLRGRIEVARDDLSRASARVEFAPRDIRARGGSESARDEAERALAELLGATDRSVVELVVTAIRIRAAEASTARGFDAVRGRDLDVEVYGELALHGVRRSITWNAVASFDDERARVRGSIELSLVKYDLRAPLSGPFAGVDVLELRLDLVGRRKER